MIRFLLFHMKLGIFFKNLNGVVDVLLKKKTLNFRRSGVYEV